MTEYKPGTVAEVTITPKGDKGRTYLAFYSGFDQEWVSAREGRVYVKSSPHTVDIRPLEVLNPDTHKVVPKDAVVLEFPDRHHAATHLVRILREDEYFWLANQIEAQTKPPRIEEPGWGEKVRAHVLFNDDRLLWVRIDNDVVRHWSCKDNNEYDRTWDELIDPEPV